MSIDVESLFQEARDGEPSAEEYRRMCEVLVARMRSLQADLAALDEHAPERRQVLRRIAEVERQVDVLREAAAISEFVEDSVWASLRGGSAVSDES